MPKPLDQLIGSMSEAEKAYFRRTTDGRDTAYLTLFNLLDRHDQPDTDELEQALLRAGHDIQLAPAKHYLLKLLMQCLRKRHSEKSGLVKLHEHRLNAHLMLERGLWQVALKELRKAKKIASQLHLRHHYLDLCLMERRLLRQYVKRQTREKLLELRNEVDHYSKQVRPANWLLGLYEDIFLADREADSTGEWRETLCRKVEKELLHSPFRLADAPFDSQSYFHLILSTYHKWKLAYEKSLHHLQALTELLESNPALQREYEYQDRYLSTLNNLFNVYLHLGRLEAAENLFDRVRRINPGNQLLEIRKFQIEYYLKLLYFIKRKMLDEAVALEPGIRSGLDKYQGKIGLAREMTFYYNLAAAWFMKEGYEQALDWLNQILLPSERTETKPLLQHHARILQVACHHQLGHARLAEGLCELGLNEMRRSGYFKKEVFTVLRQLQKILYAPDERPLEVLLATLDTLDAFEELRYGLSRP